MRVNGPLNRLEIVEKIRNIYRDNEVDSTDFYSSLIFMLCEVSLNLKLSIAQVIEGVSVGRKIMIEQLHEKEKK